MTTFAPHVNPRVDELEEMVEAAVMPTQPELRTAAALIRALKLTDQVPFDPANPKHEDFAALMEVEKAARIAIANARAVMVKGWVAEAGGSLGPVAADLGVSKQTLSRMLVDHQKRVEART
ncbi:Hypothetical protein AJAP_42700 (plasmid) [Amycolatopsis japonica]|uniref:Uncharacterized protein n=1 Tax=Amycolatopsis japonica TaxID=208439 RepID=A0A075V4K7_9PSEU|nr:hypothetical protein [Amycolatopsis japonica]AIG81307.1 Hypothetical protein AJAP_42700 [Amycolatopsis japonica]